MTNEEIVKKVKAIIVDKLGVEPSEVVVQARVFFPSVPSN